MEGKKVDEHDLDVDGILAEKERLDRLFQDKFTRVITVMFTDLKGSTSIAETQGDIATRSLIKQHNDILFPIIKGHGGVLVKTMGDGTMSYFENAQDSLRAAVEIQKGIDAFNPEKRVPIPVLIRIGIHTGKGIVEQNDIFGDVVNVAARFEGQANPGDICISEETYHALSDKGEVYCRFTKETTLKGKKEPVKLYKAFWNPTEVQKDIAGTKEIAREEPVRGLSRFAKIILFAVIPVAVLLGMYLSGVFDSSIREETRSMHRSVTVPSETK